jgi:hypothetical protein
MGLDARTSTMTPELARQFSWEAATDRFIEASAVTWGQTMNATDWACQAG